MKKFLSGVAFNTKTIKEASNLIKEELLNKTDIVNFITLNNNQVIAQATVSSVKTVFPDRDVKKEEGKNSYFTLVANSGKNTLVKVGSVSYNCYLGKFYYILKIEVEKEFQKQGIGSTILKAAEIDAIHKGAGIIKLHSQIKIEKNKKGYGYIDINKEFYVKNGFMQNEPEMDNALLPMKKRVKINNLTLRSNFNTK